MFNCLPGAMLQKGHTHQWKKGFSCSRVPPQHNAWMTASHRLFNPGPPGGRAPTRLRVPLAPLLRIRRFPSIYELGNCKKANFPRTVPESFREACARCRRTW